MIGAVKPASRSCPVVLDPTVAASFAGLIGGALGADAVQRGRSPFAERLDSEVAGEALVLQRRRPRPGRPRLGALRRRGRPPPPHGADRGRPAARLPLRHLHRAPRRGRLDRQRRPRRLPLPAVGLGLEPDRRPRLARLRAAAQRGRRRRLRHRRRRAALGRQPGHRRLLGRRLGAGDPRRGAGRAAARVHDRRRSGLDAAGPSAPPAARRAGSHSAARFEPRRC